MKGWKTFFWTAAAFNLLVGLGGFIDPAAKTVNQATALLVFAFGIVYALVAREPLRLAPVLWAGVFGKACMVALLMPGALAEGGDKMIAGILVGDMFFTAGFLAFLLGPARKSNGTGEVS
ncbi:hypothetical protein [Parerythrobacter aestuarii]|uniref:hypothetical protein n=1 Tax=Parerythrobacter aestuarii TaxID=3020909 RepID=UPI0024DE3774|nr:hypothetical protein [Parerythrobacter aestuarii]